jgi:hypothetical protein
MKSIHYVGLIFLALVMTISADPAWIAVTKISTHANNVKENDQIPQIAVDDKGNSYVVWEGFDGNDYEIYWVTITAGNTPGIVKKVSNHTDNETRDDRYPQIAVDDKGNSYVVWHGSDGDDYEIYWVKISAAGITGTVEKISTHKDNIKRDDMNPQIAADAFGNSYIVWYGSDGNDQEIYWVKISAAGTPGTVEKISTHKDNVTWNDWDPQIAVDAVGTSYIVWNGLDVNDQEIYWTTVTSTGTPGTVKKVSTHVDNADRDERSPQIAVDATGTSYIVWIGSDGNDQEIYWVTVTAAGTSGTVKKVSNHIDNETRDDRGPQIAADNKGNSYVVWFCYDGTDSDIYWVRTTSGVTGAVEKISTHNDNLIWDDTNPQIAADDNENSYVVWNGFDKNDEEIYWVTIDASGTPGKVEKISTHNDNIYGYDRDPQIAVNTGNSYVVWVGFDGDDQEIYFTSTTAVIDSAGPTISSASISLNRARNATSATLTVVVSDLATGNSPIKAVEYFMDKRGSHGTGIPLLPVDGAFDSPRETARVFIDLRDLPAGVYTVYVHGQDAQGNWGPVKIVYFRVSYISVE